MNLWYNRGNEVGAAMHHVERVYVDTSVFGGVFDEEFAEPSRAFFRMASDGRIALVVSGLVRDEIEEAPDPVSEFFADTIQLAEIVDVTEEPLSLMKAYLDAGIVSATCRDDALHVAVASVSACSMLVSWNFKHIVHYQRIPRYNAVNVLNGYGPVAIHSPMEVTRDED